MRAKTMVIDNQKYATLMHNSRYLKYILGDMDALAYNINNITASSVRLHVDNAINPGVGNVSDHKGIIRDSMSKLRRLPYRQ